MSSSYYNDSKNDSSQQSYSFIPFSGNSYKDVKNESGRTPTQYKESTITQNDIWEKKFKTEKAYQILENSEFSFHTNKKGKHPPIICDEIFIGNVKTNYRIEEIKNFSSKDENLMKNYVTFLRVLENILERIESEFSFRYKLKFTLEFKTNSIENDKVKMECNSTVVIPNEDPSEYKDENILEKAMLNGFPYLLNEINNAIYNDLKYED